MHMCKSEDYLGKIAENMGSSSTNKTMEWACRCSVAYDANGLLFIPESVSGSAASSVTS